jgi:selenide,water dikinase
MTPGPQDTPKLTSLSGSAGCASKLGQKVLGELLAGLPSLPDPNLLVGSATGDDAGVYRLDAERALVQTLDFFTPIVDDPFDYGQIAAANALSDVYAMGGRPVTAMNIVGMPIGALPGSMITLILRGGAEKVIEAGCCLVGGHSIKSPEPIYGLSVTGLVHPDKVIANTRARPGDLLLLTKPLGTGIATTAIKRGLASASLAKAAVASMARLNTPAAALAELDLVCAGTDVTGFGLLGHLANICRGSGVSAEVDAGAVPILAQEVLELIDRGCVPGGTRTNLETANEHTSWGDLPDRYRVLLTDAQTSGPLLLCVAPDRLEQTQAVLAGEGALRQAVVGWVTERNASLISVRWTK